LLRLFADWVNAGDHVFAPGGYWMSPRRLRAIRTSTGASHCHQQGCAGAARSDHNQARCSSEFIMEDLV
jgi:hypothetical protein